MMVHGFEGIHFNEIILRGIFESNSLFLLCSGLDCYHNRSRQRSDLAKNRHILSSTLSRAIPFFKLDNSKIFFLNFADIIFVSKNEMI